MHYMKLCFKNKRKYKKLLNWLARRSFLIEIYMANLLISDFIIIHVCQAIMSSFIHLCVCVLYACSCVYACAYMQALMCACVCKQVVVHMWRPEVAVGIILNHSPPSILRCSLSVKPRAFGCSFFS